MLLAWLGWHGSAGMALLAWLGWHKVEKGMQECEGGGGFSSMTEGRARLQVVGWESHILEEGEHAQGCWRPATAVASPPEARAPHEQATQESSLSMPLQMP